MNTLLFITVACAFPAPELNELQKEFAKFEGTWRLVRIEGQQKAQIPKEWPVPESFTISATRISAFVFTGASAGYHIDPTKSPRHLDVVANQNLPVQKWIYVFDGDQLKIARTFDLTLPGGEAENTRPESFLVGEDPSILVFVWKREVKRGD